MALPVLYAAALTDRRCSGGKPFSQGRMKSWVFLCLGKILLQSARSHSRAGDSPEAFGCFVLHTSLPNAQELMALNLN